MQQKEIEEEEIIVINEKSPFMKTLCRKECVF
jgi:hypothetical protein